MKTHPVKLVFFGSSDYSATTLQALSEHSEVCLVVTRPDKAKGRNKIVAETPVKTLARMLGLEIFDSEDMQALKQILTQLKPEVGILFAYGKILPLAILELFPHGILNLHPSLLPRYRGAAPVVWAIHDGVTSTGVTVILLDSQMDHGPIVAQAPYIIQPDMDAMQVTQALTKLGNQVLNNCLPPYLAGTLQPRPQDHVHAT